MSTTRETSGSDELIEAPERVWLHVYADADCWCSYHFKEDGQADKTLTEYINANTHAANVELIGKLADLLRYLRDTAFAFHLNHKPDAFSSCKHHVCQRACQAWNEATKALADQKGRD